MSKTPAKFGILAAVDGSAQSDAAVSWAAREASIRHEPVTLMHVVQPMAVSWPVAGEQATIAEWQDENARQVIKQARRELSAALDHPRPPEVRTEVLYSHVVGALADASKEARMVVVGSHGRSALGRLLLGSVSGGVLRHAHCPVAVIHGDDASGVDPTAPILLGLDGSETSEAATAWAFDEASRRGVGLADRMFGSSSGGGTPRMVRDVAGRVHVGKDFRLYRQSPPPWSAQTDLTRFKRFHASVPGTLLWENEYDI